MSSTMPYDLPGAEELATALRGLFAEKGLGLAPATVVSRRPNAYTSSSQSEVVTVRLPDGGCRDYLIKYDRLSADPPPTCRHGVAYCANVYHRLVAGMPLSHLQAVGTIHVGTPGRPALVIEHLDHALRVGEAPEVSGILAAAEWCGRFHRWAGSVRDDESLAFLARYDATFYRGWGDRAAAACAVAGRRPAWLDGFQAAFAAMGDELAAAASTVIHGEMSPQNVLWRDGEIYPVDWESAAIGPGEIDLAALLFGWPPETVDRCIAAYWQARGEPPPPGFARRWRAATAYTALRWLPLPTGPADTRFDLALDRLADVAAALTAG